jgi:hypothetical protein
LKLVEYKWVVNGEHVYSDKREKHKILVSLIIMNHNVRIKALLPRYFDKQISER